ncbi:C39 family peptidase [Candidatus Nomurabacteria bacterium]|nr:C39 family peptidase [Candidatus Nomurabacteria bacterium]MCB9819124.1 C39 family peptidase [Candidatus Nomurabacteria bacterium]
MKYIHTLVVTIVAVSTVTLYGIAYGAQNTVTYVKETPDLAQEEKTMPDTGVVVLDDTELTEEIKNESTDQNEVGTLEVETPEEEPEQPKPTKSDSATIHTVPFYSQFTNISAPEWRKIGCGIASLAMLIDFYKPGEITVDGLLEEGIAANAYVSSAGWSHSGLIGLAKSYGLSGEAVYMTDQSMSIAFSNLEEALIDGPVMVSVHYTFQPTNPIPHLVIVTGVEGGKVYYNDPAEKSGNGSISIEQFQSAWKKRYIAIRE